MLWFDFDDGANGKMKRWHDADRLYEVSSQGELFRGGTRLGAMTGKNLSGTLAFGCLSSIR